MPGTTITVEELKRAPAGSLTLLDVRKRPDDRQIRGALHYDPTKLMAAQQLALPLSHDGTIVVYCGHGNSSVEIAQRLRDQGFANAVSLEGGYAAAKEADLPLEELSQEQPIPGEPSAGNPLI